MKERKVLFIELVLENLEVVKIPGVAVDELVLQNYDRIFSIQTGELDIYKNVKLSINPQKMKGSAISLFDKQETDITKILRRIQIGSDITSIEVYFEDSSKLDFFVDWSDDELCSNKYQTERYFNSIFTINIGRK